MSVYNILCESNNIRPDDELSVGKWIKTTIDDFLNKRCVMLYWQKYR